MANDNSNLNPGGETLNERLRRAAAMARGEHPGIQQPQQPREPERRPEPIREPETPRQPEAPRPAASTTSERAPRHETPTPKEAPRFYNPGSAYEPEPDYGAERRRQEPSPRRHSYEDERQGSRGGGKMTRDPKKLTMYVSILAVLLVLAILAVVFMGVSHTRETAKQQEQIEQLQLANEQIQLANEYDALNNEFAQYENQTSLLANDSIVQKYSAARAQVEKLLQELKNEKNKSAAQIGKLKDEIATLKGILRNYVEQINALKQENQELITENQEVKARNQQLSQNIQTVTKSNQELNERMTLAEKLNVTGVQLTPLNKKGRKEKNVTKARQLMVTFTIPQNNSTPVGEKTIYLRITNPEGTLLGGGGSFSFEGSSIEATARKAIEYAGDEISGVTIYWDVNTTLTPGDYTVELFADNFRLASRKFTLKK